MENKEPTRTWSFHTYPKAQSKLKAEMAAEYRLHFVLLSPEYTFVPKQVLNLKYLPSLNKPFSKPIHFYNVYCYFYIKNFKMSTKINLRSRGAPQTNSANRTLMRFRGNLNGVLVIC